MSAPSSNIATTSSDEKADVCLLLEGTWPYVRGGVSTWVDQILTSLPEVKFAVVFIGADRKASGAPKYQSPPNLICFRELFLFDPNEPEEISERSSKATSRHWSEAHEALRLLVIPDEPARSEAESDERIAAAFIALSHLASRVPFLRFWSHPGTWELLQDVYIRHFEQVSFIDFFWNVRFLAEPVWRLLRLADQLPAASVYHSVSTGYAGLLGALAARSQPQTRFLLSEHGIYVRERISELLRAEWSQQSQNITTTAASGGIAPLRRLWIDFFIEIGRFTYHSSAAIVSLFQRNADIQAEFGAPAERIRVIPNGVNLERFDAIRENRRQKRASEADRQIVGFFGRVVAIKDVKTLLRAARLVVDILPGARFLMVGPTDEDEAYFQECERLTQELELSKFVHFGGPATPEQALPEFDVMVLSSVSEGLPFSVLEAFASAMPVVSTDVGSCSELIHGRSGESPAHGSAGSIVPVGDPAALAKALVTLLSNRSLQDQCGEAGLARARQLYAEPAIIAEYHQLYRELASSQPGAQKPSSISREPANAS
ncbi:MAG: GT4 family glycosyltransferase PelF [Verrucomicrobiae bacterium]|nr:GT4 family glycosyltransferase PelF [Verrucomicrobiae bacterium]